MKPQDDPDKATRAVQRAQSDKVFTDMIEAVEFIYDYLDSGKSFEEFAIELDIAVASGALPESSHEYFSLGFELVKALRDEGADRNEVMTYVRKDFDRSFNRCWRPIRQCAQPSNKTEVSDRDRERAWIQLELF